MTDSKRLHILKLLCAQLETITPANGYNIDLSPISAQEPRVFRGRTVFGDETALPCVSILESFADDDDPVRAGGGVHQKDDWILLINGWAKHDDDALHPTDAAHVLMADVKKCLGRVMLDMDNTQKVYMLGGAIEGLSLSAGVVRPPDETSSRSYFYLRVIVEVAERLDDPYAV